MAVSENNSLNYSEVDIYCNDLQGIPEEKILKELKQKNVSKVEKIKRKSPNGNIEEIQPQPLSQLKSQSQESAHILSNPSFVGTAYVKVI